MGTSKGLFKVHAEKIIISREEAFTVFQSLKGRFPHRWPWQCWVEELDTWIAAFTWCSFTIRNISEIAGSGHNDA